MFEYKVISAENIPFVSVLRRMGKEDWEFCASEADGRLVFKRRETDNLTRRVDNLEQKLLSDEDLKDDEHPMEWPEICNSGCKWSHVDAATEPCASCPRNQ